MPSVQFVGKGFLDDGMINHLSYSQWNILYLFKHSSLSSVSYSAADSAEASTKQTQGGNANLFG